MLWCNRIRNTNLMIYDQPFSIHAFAHFQSKYLHERATLCLSHSPALSFHGSHYCNSDRRTMGEKGKHQTYENSNVRGNNNYIKSLSAYKTRAT